MGIDLIGDQIGDQIGQFFSFSPGLRVRWIEGMKAIELKKPGGKQSSIREKRENRYEEQNKKRTGGRNESRNG